MSEVNGNGKESNDDDKSALEIIYHEWVKNGSKDPSEAEAKKLLADIKTAKAAADKARTAAEKAEAVEAEATRKLVAAYGAKGCEFLIDGVTYIPASHGERVYLRRQNANRRVISA